MVRKIGRTGRPPRHIGLIAFDLDGTLIPGTSVSRHLLAGLGKSREADDLERRYLAGEIDQRQAAKLSGRAFAGLALTEIDRRLAGLPVIRGLEATLSALALAGIPAVIATVTWTFAVRYFAARFGIARFSGTVMREAHGRLTGQVARYCSEDQKRDFVRAQARRLGLPMSRVVAVGDARSDLPLFAVAGYAIALNGSPEARAAAHASLATDDLRELVPILGLSR